MKAISIILNALNYRHSQMPRATRAIALRPNIMFKNFIIRNRVGLPAFITSFAISVLGFITYYI